jgi:hypothetical protein
MKARISSTANDDDDVSFDQLLSSSAAHAVIIVKTCERSVLLVIKFDLLKHVILKDAPTIYEIKSSILD